MLLSLAVLFFSFVACQAEDAEVLTQKEIDVFLAKHNDARTEVGVSPLKWEPILSNFAASWAGRCKIKPSLVPYGENLYTGPVRTSNNSLVAENAMKAFLDQKKYVDPPAWTCFYRDENYCGYYTQIVWSETKFVGCAIVHCKYGGPEDFVVCEYYPRGNFKNRKPY